MKPLSIIIRLVFFFGITALFIWGVIAYASSHRSSKWEESNNWTESSDSKKWERSFSFKSGGTFDLKTDVGTISVEGWDKEEVNADVHLKGNARELENFTISFDTSASRISIRGESKHNGKWFFGDWNLDAEFIVKVPRRTLVKLETSGGDVRVHTIDSSLNASTSGGNVTIEDIGGKSHIQTSGGTISAKRISSSLDGHTSGGDVWIEKAICGVTVSTSGGNLHIADVSGYIDGETSGGNVFTRIIGKNEGAKLRTSGGNVTLEIEKSVTAEVDAETSGGVVTCDLPITIQGKTEESELRGSINGGGKLITLRSSGGNIRIKSLEK